MKETGCVCVLCMWLNWNLFPHLKSKQLNWWNLAIETRFLMQTNFFNVKKMLFIDVWMESNNTNQSINQSIHIQINCIVDQNNQPHIRTPNLIIYRTFLYFKHKKNSSNLHAIQTILNKMAALQKLNKKSFSTINFAKYDIQCTDDGDQIGQKMIFGNVIHCS